jgi:hypothetical protein
MLLLFRIEPRSEVMSALFALTLHFVYTPETGWNDLVSMLGSYRQLIYIRQ